MRCIKWLSHISCDKKKSMGSACATHLLPEHGLVIVSSRFPYWLQPVAASSSRLKPPAASLARGGFSRQDPLLAKTKDCGGTIGVSECVDTLVSKVSNKPSKVARFVASHF